MNMSVTSGAWLFQFWVACVRLLVRSTPPFALTKVRRSRQPVRTGWRGNWPII